MICVIQRVDGADVSVGGEIVGKCGKGLLLLVCAVKGDIEKTSEKLAEKILKLRIFPDESGRLNRSVTDTDGQILAVSNFTLCGSCRRGTRPDFFSAENPENAKVLYDVFVETLKKGGIHTETGIFGEDMKINAALNGPVTINLDSEKDLSAEYRSGV